MQDQITPDRTENWKVGDPLHWCTPVFKSKLIRYCVRIACILQLFASISYLQYRARHTIGIKEGISAPHLAYQIFFFILEAIIAIYVIFQTVELWHPIQRDCKSFDDIPVRSLSANFSHSTSASSDLKHYPSVGVFIPCYNEPLSVVAEAVKAAALISYPSDLFSVYLCDDGQAPSKQDFVNKLRTKHPNLHYIVRSEHLHAKAGNLNHAIKKTSHDLILTLDADFVARRNIIHRLLPYFYTWNTHKAVYEFDESVAYVQTPQRFFNLSPYEPDPLDQRLTWKYTVVMPGEDRFNAAPLIGTSNMISHKALKHAGYYPYHAVTEDTALSIIMHSLGYKSFFVQETVAAGLATTSVWAHIRQRARWLKGEWQMLFSWHGVLTLKGLRPMQRFLYASAPYTWLCSIAFFCFEICAIIMLVFSVEPLHVRHPLRFAIYLTVYFASATLLPSAILFSGNGLFNSYAGSGIFENVFRYTVVKGLLVVLFRKNAITFKATAKAGSDDLPTDENLTNSSDTQSTDEDNFGTNTGSQSKMVVTIDVETKDTIMNIPHQSTAEIKNGENYDSSFYEGRRWRKRGRSRTIEENEERREDVKKNLKRMWFSFLMAGMYTFSIIWTIVRNRETISTEPQIFSVTIGVGLMSFIGHLLVSVLCFLPYLSGWTQPDLQAGRCDHYAKKKGSERLFVPLSYVMVISSVRNAILLAALVIVLINT